MLVYKQIDIWLTNINVELNTKILNKIYEGTHVKIILCIVIDDFVIKSKP